MASPSREFKSCLPLSAVGAVYPLGGGECEVWVQGSPCSTRIRMMRLQSSRVSVRRRAWSSSQEPSKSIPSNGRRFWQASSIGCGRPGRSPGASSTPSVPTRSIPGGSCSSSAGHGKRPRHAPGRASHTLRFDWRRGSPQDNLDHRLRRHRGAAPGRMILSHRGRTAVSASALGLTRNPGALVFMSHKKLAASMEPLAARAWPMR